MIFVYNNVNKSAVFCLTEKSLGIVVNTCYQLLVIIIIYNYIYLFIYELTFFIMELGMYALRS